MKKNLSRLVSIVCLLGLMVTGGYAQGLNSPPPSPVTLSGTFVTTGVVGILDDEIQNQQAISQVTLEGSAAWTTSENRILLLTATRAAYPKFNNDVEVAIVATYTKYAEHLGRNLANYIGDPDFNYLVALLTQ